MNMATVDLKKFRTEVELALAAVAEKYGCEVAAGNIKYDSTSVDIAIYFKSKRENGESAEEVDFKKHCKDYGFSMEDYGTKVNLSSRTYRLIGFNPRARKNSCIIVDSSGKQFVCSPDTILNAGAADEEDRTVFRGISRGDDRLSCSFSWNTLCNNTHIYSHCILNNVFFRSSIMV